MPFSRQRIKGLVKESWFLYEQRHTLCCAARGLTSALLSSLQIINLRQIQEVFNQFRVVLR